MSIDATQFDHHGPDYAADWEATQNRLATECPVLHTPAHGGYFLLSRYDDVTRAAKDWKTFSSHHDLPEADAFHARDAELLPADRVRRKGLSIPENTIRFVPSEADPPLHLAVRRLEATFFTPKAVARYEPVLRAHVDEALDAVAGAGRLDFAEDLAVPVTTKTALGVIGFDIDRWRDFATAARRMISVPPTSPDYPHEQIASCQAQILDLVRRRRDAPQDDVASALVHGDVLGRPLSVEEAAVVLNGLSFAGADTTTSTVSRPRPPISRSRPASPNN